MKNYIPQRGDVFSWCEEEYTCIESGEISGVVNPRGTTYYVRNFMWTIGEDSPEFLRKLTKDEFNNLFGEL